MDKPSRNPQRIQANTGAAPAAPNHLPRQDLPRRSATTDGAQPRTRQTTSPHRPPSAGNIGATPAEDEAPTKSGRPAAPEEPAAEIRAATKEAQHMKYTIFANRLDDLQRVFNRYAKKAQRAGLTPALEILDQYAKKIDIYENDHANHCQAKTGSILIDVVDINLNFPPYKIGEYTAAAVIDHTTAEGGAGNMIYKLSEEIEIPQTYRTAAAYCEHCRTAQKRNKTILLRNASGELKQVGTNCIKEYTGIEEIELLGTMQAVNSILIDADSTTGIYSGAPSEQVSAAEYLGKCIHLINTKGYYKEIKADALKPTAPAPTEAEKEAAQNVIEYFKSNNFDDDFLYNIKVQLMHEYTKPRNGFIAYAYEAYRRELEKAERQRQRAEAAAASSYYGKAGDKIKGLQVKGRIIAGYETIYGYTYIYQFTDTENHVFIWKTSKSIETDDGGNYSGTISGTIKDHTEYKGTKQTVLTRVKAETPQKPQPQQTSGDTEKAIFEALEKLY